MKADDKTYLCDIVESIELIQSYTGGITFAFLKKSSEKLDAIVRRFGIIGEAAKRLTPSCRQQMSDISWKDIVGMRDKVVHDYADIDLKMVWRTIKDDLPLLKSTIEQYLQNK